MKRRSLGIAPFRKHWRPEEIELLGTMPDAAVAQKIGRTTAAVKRRRYKLAKQEEEKERRLRKPPAGAKTKPKRTPRRR
jgi:hypothetical protein